MLVTWDCTAYVGGHPCGKPIPPLSPALTAWNTLSRMGPWDFPLSALAFQLLVRGRRCLYDPSAEISFVQLPCHIQETSVLGLWLLQSSHPLFQDFPSAFVVHMLSQMYQLGAPPAPIASYLFSAF